MHRKNPYVEYLLSTPKSFTSHTWPITWGVSHFKALIIGAKQNCLGGLNPRLHPTCPSRCALGQAGEPPR